MNILPMQRIDHNDIDIGKSEIIAFCCVRNELLRLPYFLEYHRRLGVERFIFIENASTDGTREYLLSQVDSNVYYTEDSYAGSNCGIDWLNELISKFGTNHWILTLDADEMFIYPNCETVNLRQLTKYLDMEEAQAIKSFLIDMYADKPIKYSVYKSGERFLNCCSYFDSDSYQEFNKDNLPIRGGPRHRLFWEGYNREKLSPYLINIPLIKWRKDLKYERGTHVISNLRLASLIGGKLHFKFFSDFFTSAEVEATRNEHWDDAAQYKTYWDVLSKNTNLSAMYDGSLKYKDSMQLVRLGLMKQPESYTDFINKHIKIKEKGIFKIFRRFTN